MAPHDAGDRRDAPRKRRSEVGGVPIASSDSNGDQSHQVENAGLTTNGAPDAARSSPIWPSTRASRRKWRSQPHRTAACSLMSTGPHRPVYRSTSRKRSAEQPSDSHGLPVNYLVVKAVEEFLENVLPPDELRLTRRREHAAK